MNKNVLLVFATLLLGGAFSVHASDSKFIGTVSSGQTGSVTIDLSGPYLADYTLWIVNTSTSQTVAELTTFTQYYIPDDDLIADYYYQGTSGSASGAYGEFTWQVNSLPPGTYRVYFTGYGEYNGDWYDDLSPYMDVTIESFSSN